MAATLRKLFNLYPGEGRSASLFLALGFLWSLGAFGGLTLSEGMFLEHIGSKELPFSYLLTASSMCILAAILLFALSRLSIPHLLFCVISSFIGCNLLLYFLLSVPELVTTATLWYLFKIIGWIAPVAIYICFWAFIDQYYDLQDAKRCFCLFSSILYLGDACGGGVISYGLDLIGVPGLLLLFSLALFASLPFIYLIVKRRKTVPEESIDGNPPHGSLSLKPIFKSILSSPFTLVLMLFYFLMQLIAITTEYTYMDAFEKAFATSEKAHTLTEFLGKLAMWVSLGNMLFGLFFYSRTVTRIGVNNIILIAPLFFLGIFATWSWQETLLLALFAFIAREGMSYTFDDNNLLLLISGVPSKVKNQVRIAIESFFEPIGMLIGAALLLLLQSQSKRLGLALAFISLLVVFVLRSQYSKAIFHNLMAHSIRFGKKASDWIGNYSKKEKKRAENDLLAGLKKNDEVIQLLSYEYLLKMENAALLPRLLNQAGRFSIRGKLKVIELLSESPFSHETIVIEKLEQWRKMLPHPTVRSAIYFYFAAHRLARAEQMIQHIDSEHLHLKAAAILTLKTFPEKISHSLLALEKLKGLLNSADEKEICMGLTLLGVEKRSDHLKELLPYLNSPKTNVARAAAKAICLCSDPSSKLFGPLILSSLAFTTDAEVRKYLLGAIDKMSDMNLVKELILISRHFRPLERIQIEEMGLAFGEDLVTPLSDLIQDQMHPIRARLLAGKILGRLSNFTLRHLLRPLILDEIERAHFYFYHAKKSGNIQGEERSILENALLASYRSSIDFAVQMLAIAGSLEECEVLSCAIVSKNRKIRGHAIETLEKSADPTLFVLLKPFLDERHPERLLESYLKKEAKPLQLNQLLDFMETSPSLANQIVSRTLKSRISVEAFL